MITTTVRSLRDRAARSMLPALLLLSIASHDALAQSLPVGWREVAVATPSGERLFEASGLASPEFARVRAAPPVTLGSAALQSWLTATVSADAAPAGHWTAAAVISIQSPTLLTASRAFALDSGQSGAAIYFASMSDGTQVHLYRVAFSSAPIARGPAGTAAQTLVASLIRAEKSARTPGAAPKAPVAATPMPTLAPATPAARTTGNGPRLSDIETVFYHWDQRYDAFQGLVLTEQVFVLLKDGSAYDGFKLPIEDLDVAVSRRQEPQNWGRWRRQGNSYAIAWPFEPNTFSVPRGNPVAASPRGTTLQGRFVGASSYTLPGGGVGTWSNSVVTLTKSGTFSIERSGGAAVSGGGGDSSTVTVYDDESVSSSTNSSVMAGGGRTRRPDQGDTRGTYRIDGYGIELRFENGTVERRPFFIDDAGEGIWFRGTRLMRQKEKPAQPR